MNTQIYDEASEWIILHRTDSLDPDAKRRFDTWLRESPQHLKAYLEMSTIWEEVPALNRDWNPSANELIARARAEENVVHLVPDTAVPSEKLHLELATEPPLVSVERTAVTVPASSAFTRLFSIAALLLVMVGGAGWFYLQRGVYSTDIGEQRTLALTDGSTVELNAQTKIQIAYTDNQRTIQLLRGQALFKVAKDPNRPFIVDSNGTQVRAVGTQFDVYRKDTGTTVTVVEGKVSVVPAQAGTQSGESRAQRAQDTQASGLSTQALVSAGQQLTVSAVIPAQAGIQDINALPVPKLADLEAATAWTQQRFVFDFTPLTEVAEEFNRYNRRRLVIDDPSLETFNISGSFSSTDPTLLLRFLREQPEIVVNESASEIRISRQGTGAG